MTLFLNDIQILYVNIFGNGSISNHWFWYTYQSIGLASNQLFANTYQNLKYYQISKIGFKWNQYVVTGLWIIYVSNFGKPAIIPMVNISVSTSKIVIDAELPSEFEVEYIVNHRLRVILDGTLAKHTYKDQSYENVLNFSNNVLFLGGKTNVVKYAWLQLGLTTLFKNTYQWENPASPIGTSTVTYQLTAGVVVHIE